MNTMRAAFFALLCLLVAGVLFLFALFVIAPLIRPDTSPPPETTPHQTLPQIIYGTPQKGLANAALTIVEFGDYECGPCADLEQTMTETLKSYPNVRLAWKDLPNSTWHVHAEAAAAAARCAQDQGKFWPYHDLLFANQSNLEDSNLDVFASQLGLDTKVFTACRTSGKQNPVVQHDVEEAAALGIDSTPYLFVGSQRISGEPSAIELKTAIDSELKRIGAH